MSSTSRVAVAMSGGVDSSTAAAMLRESGCDIVGFSLQLWDQRNRAGADGKPVAGRCCSLEDIYDARAVAARLGIPYYVVNLQEEFAETVVKPFIEGYLSGLTPSPCVVCNSRMKFDHLLQLAEKVQALTVATGHYARIERGGAGDRHLLLRARFQEKDQSYFLFDLNQEQLARALFPLGALRKEEVREIARRHGLEVADKAESQEICFIPDGDYAGFVERNCGSTGARAADDNFPAPGEIVDLSGRVLGRHSGIHRYTIGQRKGLGISNSTPLYVISLDPVRARVMVGDRGDLARDECIVVRPNWISVERLVAPLRVKAKIRSRHPEADAEIAPLDNGSVKVKFAQPQYAVTPGQACVFYQGDIVVGGGWIARA